MKYVCVLMALLLLLFGTHTFMYGKGYKAGADAVRIEVYEETKKQTVAIVQANKKVLDLQRVISNNNSECFNWVWDDEIIESVNPQLR